VSLRRGKEGAFRPHRVRAMAMRDEIGKIVRRFGTNVEL
jgi:hypothetical protein